MPSPSDSLMFCLPFRRVHSTCPFGDVENPNPMCYRHTHADKLNSGTSLEESKTQLHVLRASHILQREGKQKQNNNKKRCPDEILEEFNQYSGFIRLGSGTSLSQLIFRGFGGVRGVKWPKFPVGLSEKPP